MADELLTHEALLSKKPAVRQTALARLEAALLANSEAAAAAVPSLVELAAAKSTPDKHRIVALVAKLSVEHLDALLESGDFLKAATSQKKSSKRSRDGSAATLKEKAWQQMLTSTDARLRAAGAELLCLVAADPAKTGDAVAAVIPKEKDEGARASELLALGILDARLGISKNSEVLLAHSGVFRDAKNKVPPPVVAVAATLALGYSHPFAVRASMLQMLRKSSKLAVSPESVPFYDGKLGALAKKRLPVMEVLDVDAWLKEIDRLIAIHRPTKSRTSKDPKHDSAVTAPWVTLVDRVLSRFEGRAGDLVEFDELSDDERRILVFGHRRGLNTYFERLGIGHLDSRDDDAGSRGQYWSMGRYLGIVAPGALDRKVTIGARSAPWWKFFSLLGHKKFPTAPVEKALTKLSNQELVELALDVTEGAYSYSWREGCPDKSVRAALLVKALDERGLNVSKNRAIRFVLDAMANGKTDTLSDLAWISLRRVAWG
jgi:hypothetical protein